MPDIPQEAINAAAEAIGLGMAIRKPPQTLALEALEAAAPLLAEAWGVTDQERMREQIRQNNQNLLAAASEYYRLAYPEPATKEKPCRACGIKAAHDRDCPVITLYREGKTDNECANCGRDYEDHLKKCPDDCCTFEVPCEDIPGGAL